MKYLVQCFYCDCWLFLSFSILPFSSVFRFVVVCCSLCFFLFLSILYFLILLWRIEKSFWRSWSCRNVILSNNNVIKCSWFLVFFGAVLKILALSDLTSWRNLVLNSLNSSKNSFLNWWNCSVISPFLVSISWEFYFSSNIYSRFPNVWR